MDCEVEGMDIWMIIQHEGWLLKRSLLCFVRNETLPAIWVIHLMLGVLPVI